jgi:hypothetical protein
MTIPLDNLYHYIEGLFPEPVCMYLFYPHGSRDILNLIGIDSWDHHHAVVFPQVVCNDQEPLNYEFYENIASDILNNLKEKNQRPAYTNNIKAALSINIHDNVLLLHSEKNSVDLTLYQDNGYVDVYYWCHALIARDWYRFAEYDTRLVSNTAPTKDFLIYCRDWSGTREYRIKFQELLYNQNLTKNSITGIMKKNGDSIAFKDFNFKNKRFIPHNKNFFYTLANNSVIPSESANYYPSDFINSHISVILETVFDGTKIHLTEKTLRPIACGHPFMIAAGPGSLKYLRSYGFKTFEPWIDESYDQENDSVRRLEKIVDSMHEFSTLPTTNKNHVINQLEQIADYNKKWFFSKSFVDLVNKELTTNIDTAIKKVKNSKAIDFRSRKKNHNNKHLRLSHRDFVAYYLNNLRKINPSSL